jgi:hypothetical protein
MNRVSKVFSNSLLKSSTAQYKGRNKVGALFYLPVTVLRIPLARRKVQ